VKKDDLTEIVSTIVRKLLENVKEDLRKEITVESERVVKERTGELMDRVDSLEFKNHQLQEKLQEANKDNDKMRSDMKESGRRSKQASAASNQMEQFSRKLNVKVLGLEEEENESLREKIPKLVKEVTKINLDNRDIVAVHRIPGRQGQPRPVIVKFWSLDCKLPIIKKRKDFKQSKGIRLVEDVTKMNTKLINKLSRHQEIDSAWYFNGFVHGKTKSG
jgi:seryl-tRNA synthetase